MVMGPSRCTVDGIGAFNLIEGSINHHILTAHHVRVDLGGPLVWDLGFLGWGALFLISGYGLVWQGNKNVGHVDNSQTFNRDRPHI